jgi:hypothetical protein
MTDEKLGKDWQADELDAIVADYFDMLTADLAGQPYVKLRHSQALMAQIGRTHRSVEFKHQNISAVLDELGMPWIPGYKPKRNYQNAIFDAIDRYLTLHPGVFSVSSNGAPGPLPSTGIFVEAPVLNTGKDPVPERLRRLVQKFDPVKRDHLNRSLGRAGEEFVIDVEKRRLSDAGLPDLARRVRWVANEDGDGAGYDVLSFSHGGDERLIEVKTTNGSARTPFFLTRNECALANERPTEWHIYRVHQFAKEPHIFTIRPPLEHSLRLDPTIWCASFGRSA